jgi:Glycine zipper
MAYTNLPKGFAKFAARIFRSRFNALGLLATFSLMTMQPAQAQSADTWKSIAIIGGSTAAGAYIGHKVSGSKGALVGAGLGASVGYAIDRRRRAQEYYNQSASDDDGYYGRDDGYYREGGYYDPYVNSAYPYAAGYRSNSYYESPHRCASRP